MLTGPLGPDGGREVAEDVGVEVRDGGDLAGPGRLAKPPTPSLRQGP